MRRSYLRIRRNRTHNGRPYPRDPVRERDGDVAPGGDGRPAQESDAHERPVASDAFPRRPRS